MKIAISAESTVDLSHEIIKEFGINIIPFNVLLGDDEFKDDKNLTNEQIFAFVKAKGILPKTSAISVYDFENYFKELLKTNDAILHFSLSSHLSTAYNNAVSASKNLENVIIIDSGSLSTGIGLLVLSAFDKIKSGMSFEEVALSVKNQAADVQASFILNTLNYMHKGGRCSSVALLGANLLKIKPQIKLDNGKMIVGKKYKGKSLDVLLKYTEEILNENKPDLTRAFVTYSSRPEATDSVIKQVKAFGFKDVYETQAGATVCSHCGPETLGVLFINERKKNEN